MNMHDIEWWTEYTIISEVQLSVSLRQ